jgi:CelD/BcsL family acetyltransferase involved in cellulose biosynthesis
VSSVSNKVCQDIVDQATNSVLDRCYDRKNQPHPLEQMLSCELIDDFSRLQQLSLSWDRLWRADPCGEIFQSFAWARAWWQSYGEGLTLCTLAVSDRNQVIGIVPLVRQDDTIGFLGQMQSDYCDIICEDSRTVEVLSASLQKLFQLPGWKKCFLKNLKPEGRLLSHWCALPKKMRRRLQVIPGEDCRTILLNGDRTILNSLIQKDHTRRRLNKLRKAGTLTFRHIDTKAEAQVQLGYFFQHQVRRHTLIGKTSSSESPEFQKFLRTLVDELDPADSLRFGVLELDGHPLAWHFSFEVNGKFAFYQQTFNVDSFDYAPGEVLIHELLRYAQTRVEREFDFTRGDEPFKARFTTHTRKTYSMYVDRPEFRGRVRRLGRASTSALVHFEQRAQGLAKRHALMFHTFRSARLWLSGFFTRIRRERQKETLLQWGHRALHELLRATRLDKPGLELFVANCDNADASVRSVPQSVAREGQFGDLVDLAHEHPEILMPFELPKYKQRLKQGDRVYMAWTADRLALVAWTATRAPAEVLELKTVPSVLPDGTYTLMYECWSVCDNADRGPYRGLLCLLSNEARSKKRILGVCCLTTSLLLREELILQGFQARYRLVRPRTSRHFQLFNYSQQPLSEPVAASFERDRHRVKS